MLACQAAYQMAAEITTSMLKNICRATSARELIDSEMLSREVRNAAWKETSLWLAMTQPRSSRGQPPSSWLWRSKQVHRRSKVVRSDAGSLAEANEVRQNSPPARLFAFWIQPGVIAQLMQSGDS